HLDRSRRAADHRRDLGGGPPRWRAVHDHDLERGPANGPDRVQDAPIADAGRALEGRRRRVHGAVVVAGAETRRRECHAGPARQRLRFLPDAHEASLRYEAEEEEAPSTAPGPSSFRAVLALPPRAARYGAAALAS